jgi:hypothetical protein
MINRIPSTSKFDKKSYIVHSKLKDNQELQTYDVPEKLKEFQLNPHQFSVKPAIQYNKYINPAVEQPIPKRYIGQPPEQYIKQFLKANREDDPFTKYDIEQGRLEKLNLDRANEFYAKYNMEKGADERLYYQYQNRVQNSLNSIVNHPNTVLQPEDYVIIQNRLIARDQTIINDYNILYAIVNTPQLLNYVQSNIANRTGPQNVSYYHVLKASLINTFRQLRIPIPLWLDANPSNNFYNDLHENVPLNTNRETGQSLQNINFNAIRGHPVQTGADAEIPHEAEATPNNQQSNNNEIHDNRLHPEMSNQQHSDKQNIISQGHQESINKISQSGQTSGDRDDTEIGKDIKQSESIPVSHDLPQETYDHLFRQIRSQLNGSYFEEAKSAMGNVGRNILSGEYGAPGTFILDTYANIRRQYPREPGWNSIYRLLVSLRFSNKGMPHINDNFINQYKQYFDTETESMLPGALDVPEQEIAPNRNNEQTYRRFVNYITTIINNNGNVDASKRTSLLLPLGEDILRGQYGPDSSDIKFLYKFYLHRSDTSSSVNYSVADILRRVITNIVARRYTPIMSVEFERKFNNFFFSVNLNKGLRGAG